jgi:hypothetical protein
MTQNHPIQQLAPAALNVGFAPHCRRSDASGLTSQIDPFETLMVAPPGKLLHQKADHQVPCDPAVMIRT